MGREIWREFGGIFPDPRNKGSQMFGKIGGKYRSIFREKIRASKEIIRANFVLQTCHPKKESFPLLHRLQDPSPSRATDFCPLLVLKCRKGGGGQRGLA